MQIHVRTGGLLYEYLPEDRRGNRAALELADGATASDAMRALGLPMDQPYLVSLNGEVVRQADRATTSLADQDELAIMPPLRGG